MNEKKIHKNFIDDPSPVGIPSADEAWTNMEKKLAGEEHEKPAFVGWLYSAAVVFVVALVGLLILNHNSSKKDLHPSKKSTTNHSGTATATSRSSKSLEETNSAGKEGTGNTGDTVYNILTAHEGKMQRRQLASSRSTVIVLKHKRKNQEKQYLAKTEAQQKATPFTESKNEMKTQEPMASDTSTKNMPVDQPAKAKADTISKGKDTTNVAAQSEEETISPKTIQGGLEWSEQIPTGNTSAYFAGPNGSSQPYSMLLPGFWVATQVDKNMFTIHVNPFATAVLSDKPYATTNTINGSDIVIEKRTLHKIFGTSAGFDYDYNIKSKWWIGGNFLSQLWHSATATVQGEKISAPAGAASVLYKNNYRLSDSAWSDFTKFQSGLGVQLLYKLPRCMAGVRFNYNFAPLIDKDGQRNTTNAQVFIRLQLYSDKKNK